MNALKTCVLAGLFIVLAVAIAACGPAATSTSAPTAPVSAGSYTDPFAYCAAVGDVDQPDARYTGPAMPDPVVAALRKATGASADAPLAQGSFWRCMGSKVYGCFIGANIPCQEKANTDKNPTAEEIDFCKAQTSADVIPAAVTGHSTVYEWRCTDGKPTIVSQVLQVDARGYPTQFWYELTPNP